MHCLSQLVHCLSLLVHFLSLLVHCLSLLVHCLPLLMHCLSLLVHCLSLLLHCLSTNTELNVSKYIYVYISDSGILALPNLRKTKILLFPFTVLGLLYILSLILQWNLAKVFHLYNVVKGHWNTDPIQRVISRLYALPHGYLSTESMCAGSPTLRYYILMDYWIVIRMAIAIFLDTCCCLWLFSVLVFRCFKIAELDLLIVMAFFLVDFIYA